MDPVAVTKAVTLGILILASAFFSSSEAALFSLGLYRVRRLKTVAYQSYQAAQKLISEPPKLLSTLLTGNEILNAAIGVVGSSLVYHLARGRVDAEILPFLAVICVLPFVLIFGEIVPKTFALRFPEQVVAVAAVPLYWFSHLIAPLRNGLAWIADRALGLAGQPPARSAGVSEAVFRTMVDAGAKEGVLDEQERKLIHNVFDLDDIRVERIMTHKRKVSCVRADMTLAEALAQIEADRYSRYPVLDEDNERVVGTLYSKDLLGLPVHNPEMPIRSFVRPPLLVPRETTALHLFAQFRAKRTHFGIVCGTFAHEMVGVVTLEDILEEVFGDIRDERDIEEAPPSKR